MPEHATKVREPGSLERALVASVVGLVAAVLVLISLEPLLARLYPVLGTSALGVTARIRQSGSLPVSSLLLLLGAYALASFVGGLASSLTSGRIRARPALITGVVLMVAGTWAVMAGYQPLWFRAGTFLTYPMAYVGYLVVRRRAEHPA